MSSIRSRAPQASSPEVRRVMCSVRSEDTRAEQQLRRELHREGLRFRKNQKPETNIRCKADIVFRRARVCVFIDGCFWHGCPTHFHPPKKNQAWWIEKIMDNIDRDRKQAELLSKRGWMIIRVWEHDIEKNVPINLILWIKNIVMRRKAGKEDNIGKSYFWPNLD